MKQNIVLVGCHKMTSTLVQKFQELNPEIDIVSVNEHLQNPFDREPIIFTAKEHDDFSHLYDKKGKLFKPPKSKFHR